MPVKGCGVDLIEISRISKAIQKERFRRKIYTRHEREYLENKAPQSWATRFAAKEAVMKSLGRGWQQGVSFKDVEIYSDHWGQPNIRLSGGALEIATSKGVTNFVLSLSHTKELAIAYVIALRED